jgi:hypothetical protein
VSCVSVVFDYDDGAKPEREHVLAVWRLRRNLERLATGGRAEPGVSMAVSAPDLRRDLEELIAALDQRVPRVERAGEALIARDAAALRAKAVARLAELTGTVAIRTATAGDAS